MTDDEFNILDELYFVQSFSDLVKLSGYCEQTLIPILISLRQKGWVTFLKEVDVEWEPADLNADQLANSFFLVTKKGLFAHNS